MRTSEFPWHDPPFDEFNPPQAQVVPLLSGDGNVAVSFPTAVGKTVLAECMFAFHLAKNPGCRAVYLCPTKGIAMERRDDWAESATFGPYGVVLCTGDSTATAEELMAGRLAVMTYESYDSRTRKRAFREWIRSLAVLVVDEAQALGERRRGAALEAALVRTFLDGASPRMLLLSSGVSNVEEVSRWMALLTGRETAWFTTAWRPTKIELETVEADTFQMKVDEVCRIANRSLGGLLVFVCSKEVGRRLAADVRKRVTPLVEFHNSSLSGEKRAGIEKRFREGGIRVLVSTSTLGSGVNL